MPPPQAVSEKPALGLQLLASPGGGGVPAGPFLPVLAPGQARGGHHFLSQAKTEVRGHLGARYRGPAARGGRGSPRCELVGVAVSGARTLHQVPHSCTRWRWVGPVHTHPPTRPPEQGAHTHPPTSPPEQGAKSQASLIKVYSYTSLQSCRRGGAVCSVGCDVIGSAQCMWKCRSPRAARPRSLRSGPGRH